MKGNQHVSSSTIPEATYRRYLDALLLGERKECLCLVQELQQAGVGIRELYLNLFQRSLYDSGNLWETHQISVSNEHLATAITEYLIAVTSSSLFSVERVGKSAVVSCVASESHQMGAIMVANTLEFNGWDSYFFGGNTPTVDLVQAIREKEPDLVALSLSLSHRMPQLKTLVCSICEAFPRQKIMIGGQAFYHCNDISELELEPAEYISDLSSFEASLHNL